MRTIPAILLVLISSTIATAQDLPLRDILVDGQGWVASPAPATGPKLRATPDPMLNGSVSGWSGMRPRVETAMSRDGATLFVVNSVDPWVYAVPCADGMPKAAGSKYAPLRLARGKSESGAGSIVLDTVGRIYVATTAGIQVFDPTGRLCGVLHPTADGPLDALRWDGPDNSTLTGRAGGKTYRRVMNVTGGT